MYGQEQQYKVIRSHHLHKASVMQYLERYMSGDDILQLSADVDFPPCMLLRRMLERLIDAPKQAVGEVLRHPERLDAALVPGAPPELIARLRADVVRCVHADCSYSPLSDVAKQATGLEYELYLQQRLAAARLPFWSESELRQLGFHKTPDCKLKVPMAVRTRSGSEHLVCWVDSKATFGDARTHVKQVEEQYATYVNRYGPGMVIYWFGFVESLNTDPLVLLCDDFPEEGAIIRIQDCLADPKAAAAKPQPQPLAAAAKPAAVQPQALDQVQAQAQTQATPAMEPKGGARSTDDAAEPKAVVEGTEPTGGWWVGALSWRGRV
ncbi:hypothetical protein HYH03_004266 [Edaphochlamys debaryana]|uniref:CDAN1-interacting nuclease 1 n=1 Tax=Edaphochlamys debaryana TaxID=47281 RepID=A0A835YB22_9CHLO|nr:hypothetical protein HYH03_004266 [Edaphochlamys debaryana]|eukprot:KAG2498008.1 hypothetical protein HYH03_004266 [Edaphochlamys debaryana]